MIITLTGQITHRTLDFVILDVAGVGFRLFCTPPLLATLSPGTNTTLFTHEAIREDGRDIYGFATLDDLELFWKLITVSGIGPRAASHIMAIGPAGEIRTAIEAGDLTKLTSVPGVGKKKAQQIVLTLKGKLVGTETTISDDLLDALVGMGYSKEEAHEALKEIPSDLPDAGRLKIALKNLRH